MIRLTRKNRDLPFLEIEIEESKIGELLVIGAEDQTSYTELVLTKLQALRLSSILTTWAETGELPEGVEVWE